MKNLFLYPLIFVSFTVFSQNQEVAVQSTISEVTVYLQGAQITRSFDAAVSAGSWILAVGDLPAQIEARSIQVKALNSDVKVLAVSSRLNYLDQKEKPKLVAGLIDQRDTFKEKIKEYEVWLSVYGEEESLLLANKTIGGVDQGVNIDELKQAAEYYRERLSEIKLKKLEISREIEALAEELAKVNSQLAALNSKKPEPKREVLIKISTKSPATSKFILTYMVEEAGWLPAYDIRAETIDKPIEVVYKAKVQQNTGEDWKKVKLTLSNANPSQSSVAPSLNTWYLGFNNRLASENSSTRNFYGPGNEISGRVVSAEDNQPLPGVTVMIKGTSVGTVTDIDGYYRLPLTQDAEVIVYSFIGMKQEEQPIGQRRIIDVSMEPDVMKLEEVVVVGYGTMAGSVAGVSTDHSYRPKVKKEIAATPVVKQTTMEFTVTEPYTIIADGRNQMVDMISYEMPATYQYFAVPKLDTDAFLKAQITDWEGYNFLPGEASLFFEGKFIGKTVLDTRYIKDTLNISLGRDKSIAITREKVADFSSVQFIGNNRKELVGFRIGVRNKKAHTVEIIIEDQVPIPTNKDIGVELLRYDEAEHNEENGNLRWALHLEPGESREINLQYEVKYPKYRQLLLE